MTQPYHRQNLFFVIDIPIGLLSHVELTAVKLYESFGKEAFSINLNQRKFGMPDFLMNEIYSYTNISLCNKDLYGDSNIYCGSNGIQLSGLPTLGIQHFNYSQ
jgi:hypothetical protein